MINVFRSILKENKILFLSYSLLYNFYDTYVLYNLGRVKIEPQISINNDLIIEFKGR